MSEIYLILIVVLFALAISDLIVGVANDAVNFLNSAIGSKAAPKWIIFGVAALGVLVGSTFSSGMMEVARKGIFNPEAFVFSEIMIIFLAVMITDVILLDLFNTFGFPTSTTVSIVFELLGAAVSVSLAKMNMAGEPASELGKYINSEKALLIITGILISVVIAFSVGAIIHWLTRVLFSFRYNKRLKYFGSLYGGLAIASITYFMIIKGAKGASFITPENAQWLKDNMFQILLVSFAFWSFLLQLLRWFFKIDILKVIVLVGTFALAMAFAGNDLVNFIGVPLAGFSSFKAWVSSGVQPDLLSMEMLRGAVKTPTYMLLIAGVVMIATLIFSRKALSVVKTSVDLSRQTEGEERFGSSAISRFIVNASVKTSEAFNKITPSRVSGMLARQFEPAPVDLSIPPAERPAFDKIRAASNLIIASILISIGTSLKLPLSTTYVTFMVAMGTSLADKAWGRESAVYRISGVFAVIGGWFLTAFIAFTVSFIIAKIILWGKFIAIFALCIVAVIIIIRTQIHFRKKTKAKASEKEEIFEQSTNAIKVIEKCNKNSVSAIISTSKAYSLCFEGFFNSDRQQLKAALKEDKEFNEKAKKLKDNVFKAINKLQKDQVDTGHFYVQVVDYLREMAHSVHFLVNPVFIHFDNMHKPFVPEQIKQLQEFGSELNDFFNFTLYILNDKKLYAIDELIEKRDQLLVKLRAIEKGQIKRIKANEVSTRNSLLFFNIITETKNMLLNMINLIKAQRDFLIETKTNI
ncbi:MAG: inorganic phosphate transporter [Prolixibacteraceae bacterium]|nr:inorganic phosphate transporter [Prolixibacteraceae bacterium]